VKSLTLCVGLFCFWAVQGFKGSKVQGFKGSGVQGFNGGIDLAESNLKVISIRLLHMLVALASAGRFTGLIRFFVLLWIVR